MVRRNVLVGCVLAVVTGKKPPASTLYPAQGRDRALSYTIECPTRHLLDLLARANPSLLVKTHGSFERASGQDGRLTILRIHITAEALNVVSNYQSPFEKTLLTLGTTYI